MNRIGRMKQALRSAFLLSKWEILIYSKSGKPIYYKFNLATTTGMITSPVVTVTGGDGCVSVSARISLSLMTYSLLIHDLISLACNLLLTSFVVNYCARTADVKIRMKNQEVLRDHLSQSYLSLLSIHRNAECKYRAKGLCTEQRR